MSQQEKVFANGIIFKRNDKAPDWVIGNISIKADDFSQFMNQNLKNGWLNLGIKKASSGKIYIELDTYDRSTVTNNQQINNDDDLGF